MKRYLFVLAILAVGVTTGSCSKLFKPSVKKILTKAKWNIDKIKIYEDGDPVYSTNVDDTTIEFKKNGRYEVEEDGETIDEGDWELKDKDKKIRLDPDDDSSVTYDIEKIEKDDMIWSTEEDGYEYKIYFSR